jgi:hypothetical protein
MAITTAASAKGAIGLEQFLAYVEREVDEHDVDSILASADQLFALSLNEDLLIDSLNDCIRHLVKSENSSLFYSSHSFVLGRVGRMTVRGNIWPDTRAFDATPHRKEHVRHVYAYYYPHDHNFDFLTVGWHGPGYTTDIYEYDYDQVDGMLGEKVCLRFLERTDLCKGKTMFFRKGRDVHVQYPPKSVSVSLNLLIDSPDSRTKEQFEFNLPDSTISNFVWGTNISRAALVLEFAGLLGNEESVDLMVDMALKSPVGRLRACAMRSLQQLTGAIPTNLLERAERDRSPHVRAAFYDFQKKGD